MLFQLLWDQARLSAYLEISQRKAINSSLGIAYKLGMSPVILVEPQYLKTLPIFPTIFLNIEQNLRDRTFRFMVFDRVANDIVRGGGLRTRLCALGTKASFGRGASGIDERVAALPATYFLRETVTLNH